MIPEYKAGQPIACDTQPLDWGTINEMFVQLRKRRNEIPREPMIYCGSKEKPILEWMLREYEAEARWREETHRKWWAKLTPAQRIREQRFMDRVQKVKWQLARKPVVTPGDPGFSIHYHNPTAAYDENGEYL